MSDQFWSSVAGALVGALAAGVISALIAWRVFAGERKARQQERLQESRDVALRLRTTAVSELITALRQIANSDGFEEIPPHLQNAAQALLLDGTEESFIVYKYVLMELGYIAEYTGAAPATNALITADATISMLIAWVRDEKDALEIIQVQVEMASESN